VVLTTCVVDTGKKSAATDTPIKVNLGKDATTGVVDTGGKFGATINDSNGQLAVEMKNEKPAVKKSRDPVPLSLSREYLTSILFCCNTMPSLI
jgi:hypothetical protein